MVDSFVLDTSVAIRWLLQDGSEADRAYADQVLDVLLMAHAYVPALWYTEMVHVLRCAEKAGQIGESDLVEFLYQLSQLPIVMDNATPSAIQLSVAAISREFKLSGYDAQYLELARRNHIPLATLDKELRKVAKQAGGAILLLQ